MATLRRLENDETLLVQSGKPVGVFTTHEEAPRVLIANAHLVPRWATWDEFRRLEALGLTMYGQMTAGSWIYIGTQGILQGTYETFAECARQHFGGTLKGRLVVTGGLGGMGGAQPLAATMNGAAFLGVDVDEERIRRRVATRYCDRLETSLDTALQQVESARSRGQALSVGLVGNIAEVLPELLRRGVVPDVVTDQTSAHDLRLGYIPAGLDLEQAGELRESRSPGLRGQGPRFHGGPCAGHARSPGPRRRCVRLWQQPSGTGGRPSGHAVGLRDPGLCAGVHPPALLPGCRPVSLGCALGRSRRHRRHRPGCAGHLPGRRKALARWIRQAQQRVAFQGLPARICWLEYGERAEMGERFNWLVKNRTGARSHRDRSRSSGHRIGGLSQPRDRGNEGWLRCDRRLAAAECAAEHRLRRQLGLASSRRRRRHRLFHSCRHGGGGRWDRRQPTGGCDGSSPPILAPE